MFIRNAVIYDFGYSFSVGSCLITQKFFPPHLSSSSAGIREGLSSSEALQAREVWGDS